MFLGAQVLINVSGVNAFEAATEFRHRQGSTANLYIQLIDLDRNRSGEPAGLRYMPADASTLTVTLGSIDEALVATKTAMQPFSQDPSIWMVQIQSTDDFGQGNIEIELTEGGVVRKARILNGVVVDPDDPSFC